ncbi:MAG: hypothetical protein WC289_03070 [Patescibacteria group bacterium]|jgi:hypothetical protein
MKLAFQKKMIIALGTGVLICAGYLVAERALFGMMPTMYILSTPLPSWVSRWLDIALLLPYLFCVVYMRMRKFSYLDVRKKMLDAFFPAIALGCGLGIGLAADFMEAQSISTYAQLMFGGFITAACVPIGLFFLFTAGGPIEGAACAIIFYSGLVLSLIGSALTASPLALLLIVCAGCPFLQFVMVSIEPRGIYSCGIGVALGMGLGVGLLTGMVNGYIMGGAMIAFLTMMAWLRVRLGGRDKKEFFSLTATLSGLLPRCPGCIAHLRKY